MRTTTIIPCHNYGHFLDTALRSAVAQTYPTTVCVVDDGSTDDSWQRIEAFVASDMGLDYIEPTTEYGEDIELYIRVGNRIGIKRKVAGGPSRARNTAICELAGESDLFAMLDADDWWEPTKVEKSVNVFQQYPLVGAVYTDNINLHYQADPEIRIREFREPFNAKRLLEHNYVHSGCVVSLRALNAVGLYDEEMRVAEDWDLWIRIAERFDLWHIAEPLVWTRVGQQNTSNSVNMEVWQQNWARIREKLEKRRV